MPKIVAVPEIGEIEFPDNLSETDISGVIEKELAGRRQVVAPVQEAPALTAYEQDILADTPQPEHPIFGKSALAIEQERVRKDAATPTLKKTDPRFPEIAADVATGEATFNAQMAPWNIPDTTGQGYPQAWVDAEKAKTEYEGLRKNLMSQKTDTDPDLDLTLMLAYDRMKVTERKRDDLKARSDANVPEDPRQIEARRITESNEAFKKYLNDTGQAPGVVGTFLEDVGSKFTNMGASILQTFAPSLGSGPAQALRNHAEQMGEVASINTGLGGAVGRGAGTVASLVLGGPKGQIAGLTSATVRGALETHSRVLQATGDTAEADRQTLATYPALALYMLGGAAGAKLGGAMVVKTASPMAKSIAGFGGALVGNVVPSVATQGENYNAESAITDTLLAVFHARGEYKKGVSDQQRAEAFQKLRSMGWSEERINAPFQAGAEQPASLAMRGPEEVQPFAIETSTGKPPQSVEVLGETAPSRNSSPATPGEMAAELDKFASHQRRQNAWKALRGQMPVEMQRVADQILQKIEKGEKLSEEEAGILNELNAFVEKHAKAQEEQDRQSDSNETNTGKSEVPVSAPLTVHDIVPAIRIGEEIIQGKPNETHQDILNRWRSETNPTDEQWGNALVGFLDDATHVFSDSTGKVIDRAELKTKFDVSDSQGLRRKQAETPKPVGSEGPGAAAATEQLASPPGPPTSNKEAVVNPERAARQLDPVIKEARIGNAESIDRAETILEQNPAKGDEIVTRLRTNPQERSISLEDAAVLLVQKTNLVNQRRGEETRINDPNSSPEEKAEATQRFKDVETKIAEMDQAAQDARATWGRFGQLYQRTMRDDYSLTGMEAKARVLKGPLSPGDITTIKQLSDRGTEAQKTLGEREVAIEETASAEAAREAVAVAAKYHPKVLEYAEGIVSRWEAEAVKARQDIREAMGLASANPLQFKVAAAAFKIARAKIARGLLNASEFTADMVKEFGEKVREFLKPAWDKAMKAVGGLDATKTRKKSARQLEVEAKAGEEAVSTEDGIKAVVKEGETNLDALAPYIKKLGKEYVQSGEATVEGLEARLHTFFEPLLPGVTPRQLRDAFSDYGKSKGATTDPVKIAQAQRRGEAQKLSALEDLIAKRAALATGQQRPEMSERYRQLTKQINEKKKELGIVDGDPATRLKTTLESMEKRTQNRINDLRFEIARRERIVRKKGELPTGPKLEELKRELKEVEAEHKSIFGDRKLTDEQRLKSAIASAKRIEQIELERLANAKKGIFEKPAEKGVTRFAEVDAIKARTEAAREERKALEMAANPPLSKAQKALDAALVSKERWNQLLAGEVAPAKKMPREALSELEADARAEIAAMRELAAEIRKAEKPKTDPDIATIKALEKAAAEYERRVNEADFSPKGKKQGPDTAKVAQARALRDAAKAAYDAALKARKPVRTKEEIAIQNYKARATRQLADLQDRIAKGDFGPRPKKPKLDISQDPEAIRAEAEIRRVRTEFNQKQEQWLRDQRSALKKTWDGAAEVLASSRTLITSADLSAPFRQGGVFSIGDLVFNPRRLGRQLGGMLKSAVSETGFQNQEAALRLRPNAELYQSSGLYIADIDGRFTTREENMRSNLAEKIPVVGRLVRGSNRAYASFLNRQRADAFDSFIDLMGGKSNVKPQDARFFAQAVNDLTGRGEVSKSMAGAMNFLSRYLFSPRFLISRFKTLAGVPIIRGRWSGPEAVSLRARAAVAMPYAKMAASLTVLYGLAKLAGAAIEDDPRSTDFGKLRLGNTRIDPLAGLQQYAVLAARTATREQKDSKGKVRPIVASTFGNFMRSKLAPIPGAAINIATGSNVVGEKTTALSTTKSLTVPISYQEVGELYEAHGATKASIIQLLNLIGFGTAHYGKK